MVTSQLQELETKMNYLRKYIDKASVDEKDLAAIAYLATLDLLMRDHPSIANQIISELKDQRSTLKLIASENYSSLAVQLAMGNLLTDKYAEGFPHHRFYAGCKNVDQIEEQAVNELKKLYNCDHAYVQPHSGADANLIAFIALLVERVQKPEVEALGKKNITELSPEEHEKLRKLMLDQKMMGMSLNSGGHLTHGYSWNISSKLFNVTPYEVDRETEMLDYAVLQDQVDQVKPAVLLAGYSAYPRLLDFAKFREIADRVGAILMVDMAHFSGLVAGKAVTGNFNPVPFADIITSTTHKTLRGPRGGMILCKEAYREVIDKGCPLVMGGPLPHVMAAKAVAFREANSPSFCNYAEQILSNARALADSLLGEGMRLVTGGTENHLIVADVMHSFGLTGLQAEQALRNASLTVNRNSIPFDTQRPWLGSGIRIGTPALTTRGMKEEEMRLIGKLIVVLLKACTPELTKEGKQSRSQVNIDATILHNVRTQIEELLESFPLYPELEI